MAAKIRTQACVALSAERASMKLSVIIAKSHFARNPMSRRCPTLAASRTPSCAKCFASRLVEPSVHPFRGGYWDRRLLPRSMRGNYIFADAVARQNHTAGLNNGLRADTLVLPAKPHSTAFFPNFATGSDQDAAWRFKLAQVDAHSRPGLKWATG